jgi:hypothetical protein
MIDHRLSLHDDARRTRSARFYVELERQEAYFADRASSSDAGAVADPRLRPIDDERLQKIAIVRWSRSSSQPTGAQRR